MQNPSFYIELLFLLTAVRINNSITINCSSITMYQQSQQSLHYFFMFFFFLFYVCCVGGFPQKYAVVIYQRDIIVQLALLI